MDGREVHSVENTNPRIFTNVRVFAGDKVKPAADASYRNLLWENFHVDHSFNIGTKIQENKQIGTIDSWGPFFRVSFDLIIHSFVKGKGKQGWSSVLAFNKKPSVDLNKNGELRIFFQQRKYNFISNVDLNRWYTISIEQKPNNKKVREKQVLRKAS